MADTFLTAAYVTDIAIDWRIFTPLLQIGYPHPTGEDQQEQNDSHRHLRSLSPLSSFMRYTNSTPNILDSQQADPPVENEKTFGKNGCLWPFVVLIDRAFPIISVC
jgi:hypothetical protein